MKKTVHDILQAATPDNRVSRAFDLFLITLISLNAVALILSTVQEIHEVAPQAFRIFEVVSIAVFTTEYLLRAWCCTEEERYASPLWGRLWYAISPLALIDLMALVPFYVAVFGGFSALDLRLLRTVRLLAQVARLSRYSSGIRTLARVMHDRGPQLLTVIMVLTVLLLIAASLMFFAEHKAQPRQVRQHTRSHVVERDNPDHRGIRRCCSCHRMGPSARRPYSRAGHRFVRSACWHFGVGLRRRTTSRTRTAAYDLPPLRGRDSPRVTTRKAFPAYYVIPARACSRRA